MKRRDFLKKSAVSIAGLLLSSSFADAMQSPPKFKRPNILFIVADDMNWDTPNCFGGTVKDLTPNIDQLAKEGLRFEYAHVTVAVCQPSRSVLMTGKYPHRNGATGFGPVKTNVTTLEELLKKAGYINGILGKVSHLQPVSKFKWSFVYDFEKLHCGRDPQLYYNYSKQFFQQAKANNQPFFLMANSHDPHRPFSGSADEKKTFAKVLDTIPAPSKIYKEDEITVPGFLPDIPEVHKEITQYYNSCRRCDDTVGAVLKALKESGQEDDTLVMFLSDNGMAFPFAKTNCYLNSTRTPWIVRWPGITKPDTTDHQHFISGIDFMPTILDAARINQPKGMDGRSFLPLLKGQTQSGRDKVFTVFHENISKILYQMRCVQNHRFGYIFNAWSNGKKVFHNESQSGLSMNAMKKAAQTDPKIAERVKFFLYRVPEELYDFSADPDALKNLANDPAYKENVKSMRKELFDWMKQTGDPIEKEFKDYLQNKPIT